ncbi:MAG: glycoside hydrolase family 3 C-terminal domain-containing protein [Ardenticatenaceae bacterium]|nr:glycoside hydrolase family 3 C-terminal domain-containing protein [Ardenticatenaceae bacterium]
MSTSITRRCATSAAIHKTRLRHPRFGDDPALTAEDGCCFGGRHAGRRRCRHDQTFSGHWRGQSGFPLHPARAGPQPGTIGRGGVTAVPHRHQRRSQTGDDWAFCHPRPHRQHRAARHALPRRDARFCADELGFDGIVISDALDMGAISQGAGQIVDVITAVRAEVDLLLLTSSAEVQERLYAGLQLALSRGLIDATHLQPSLARIMALKRWVGQMPQPLLEVVGCAEHQALAQEVANRSITLVRNEANLLPLRLESDAKIAVIMPQPKDLTPADTSSFITPTLATAVRAHHPHVDEFITSHPPTADEIANLRQKASEYDLLIVGTLSASLDEMQAELVRGLLDTAVPTITVALRTPYDLTVYPQTQTHVCSYSILPVSMRALADALFGAIPFVGKLPVRLGVGNQ